MEQEIGKNLMRELKIDVTQIVREEWEMKILEIIFASDLSLTLVFKGGTTLRLAYNSPRFSEDLDFSLINDFDKKSFEQVISQIKQKYPEVILAEIQNKFYTHFAQIKIREPWLNQAFSIKIEISKRKSSDENEIRTLTSPTTNIQVVARCQTLDQIFSDKKRAVSTRVKARDFFDLWYLFQLTRKPADLPKIKVSAEQMRAELRIFLPNSYWPVADQIITQISK